MHLFRHLVINVQGFDKIGNSGNEDIFIDNLVLWSQVGR